MRFVASATGSRARSDDEAILGIVEEEQQSHRPVLSPPGGQMGVVDDLCVGRRRRWPRIVFLLLPLSRLTSPIRIHHRIYGRKHLAILRPGGRLDVFHDAAGKCSHRKDRSDPHVEQGLNVLVGNGTPDKEDRVPVSLLVQGLDELGD